ncbi:MAG: hypothetical protein R2851_08565 [Caldilineaceae bacterium]
MINTPRGAQRLSNLSEKKKTGNPLNVAITSDSPTRCGRRAQLVEVDKQEIIVHAGADAAGKYRQEERDPDLAAQEVITQPRPEAVADAGAGHGQTSGGNEAQAQKDG